MRERIDSFLFAPAAPGAVRVFRVALAIMLAFAFWPRDLAPAGSVQQSRELLRLYESAFLLPGYWAGVLALVGLFGAGWRPRLTGVLLFLMLLPLAHLSRGRQSRHVLLVALACFSLLRSGERDLRAGDAGPMWPVQLIRFQLTFLYGLNAFWKSTPHYLSGDALMGMSVQRSNFLVDLSDGFWHVGPIAVPVAVAAVASTLTEAFLAVGFWFPRTRKIAALVGVGFHLLLQQIVRIFMLDLVSMFLYLAFLLPFERKAHARRLTGSESRAGVE